MKFKFLFLFLCLIFAGCKFPYLMQRELEFDKSEFTKNKNKWTYRNIKNYEYTFEYTDIINKKTKKNVYKITNKKCVSADYYVQNDNGNYDDKPSETKISNGTNLKYSIDDWFERIERDYNKYKSKNFEKERIASVTMEVVYNKKYNYPEKYDFIIYYDDDVEVTYDGSIPSVNYTHPADYNPTVINIVEFNVIEEEPENAPPADTPENGESGDAGEKDTPAATGNEESGENESAGGNAAETGTPESAEG